MMKPNSSLYLLLFSNIVTIFLAVEQNWNLPTVMWVYWFQSVSIGLFHAVRIFRLKEFSTDRYKMNGVQPPATPETKNATARFFLFHYGIFHFAYAYFLSVAEFPDTFGHAPDASGMYSVYFASLLFFLNHAISFVRNPPVDTKETNIGTLLFYPYLRIIPMHLMPFFSSTVIGALPFFLLLKTAADAGMHLVEQNVLIKRRK